MRAKLGLFTPEPDDAALADDLLDWMQRRAADFTNTFVALTAGRAARRHGDGRSGCRGLAAPAGGAPRPPAAVAGRRSPSLMRRHNPAVIPRNHHVEAALVAATDGDVSGVERLLAALAAPYDHDRDAGPFNSPGPDPRPYRTFCGT